MSLVLTDVQDGIATVTMNRPEKRNALSPQLIDALGQALQDLEHRSEVRVMILTGAGQSFCAGMDLRGVVDDPAAMAVMLQRLSEVARQIRRLPVPTIARVNGAAIGGGVGLLSACDFAIASDKAVFSFDDNIGEMV